MMDICVYVYVYSIQWSTKLFEPLVLIVTSSPVDHPSFARAPSSLFRHRPLLCDEKSGAVAWCRRDDAPNFQTSPLGVWW